MLTLLSRGWVVGLLAGLVLLGGPSPVSAHAELESSDPKDGATLSSAPAAITFVFGEQILEAGNAVTLTQVADDTRLDVGPVEVDGDTVSVGWPESSAAGEFRAAYRVVSADGHPIDGTITFTVEEAVEVVQVTPSGATSPAQASAGPSATSTGPAPTSASPSATSASPSPAADDADAGLLMWVLAIGLGVLAAAGVVAWVMRRSR